MASNNVVVLYGRLTRDAEIREVETQKGGTSLAKFGLAVTNHRNDDATMFIECTAWGRTAQVVGDYTTKGAAVLVTGELVLERWQSKDGENRQRYTVNVATVQLMPKGQGGEEPQQRKDTSHYPTDPPAPTGDAIPF